MADFFVFQRPLDEYKVNINPLRDYMKQASTYISKIKDISIEEAESKLKEIIREHPVKNPRVKYRYRNDVGDVETREMGILNYIKEAQDSGEVIAPSFTTYIHPSVRKSLHAEFLFKNVAARSKDKKLAFKYKLEKNKELASYYNTSQKARKIFNNSLSGAYGSAGSILTNPSAHYTLTSTTMCTASIGNATTESILAGNKLFLNPEAIMNYILTVITNIKPEVIKEAIDKFNLHIPTVDEVYKHITDIAKWYFNTKSKLKDVKELLEKLDDIERAAVLYVNDFWHLKEYNDEFLRTFIDKLNKKCRGVENPLDVLNNTDGGILNLLHHICAEEIKGKNIVYKELEPELLDLLGSTANNLTQTFLDYKILFDAFYTTDILPINIAYIKQMMREVIVLSDTDSTCGTYERWVEWYTGNTAITPDGIGCSAIIMTINTQLIAHNLKILSASMNVDKDRMNLLQMKNEYFWYSFVPMNINKHYFADTAIKEGNVFEETEDELKGVHLISSKLEEEIRQGAFEMMTKVKNAAKDGEPIEVRELIKQVADLERSIKKRIQEGDTKILNTDTIKPAKAYKQEPHLSKYQYHIMWKELFEDKYGESGEPIYEIFNIPTTLNTEKKLKDFIAEHPDQDFAERFQKYLTRNNKKTYGCFRIPVMCVEKNGIPKEIEHCIDYFRIVKECCKQYYNILESLGFFRKTNLLISEMGDY